MEAFSYAGTPEEQKANREWLESRIRRFEIREPLRSMLPGFRITVSRDGSHLNFKFQCKDRDHRADEGPVLFGVEPLGFTSCVAVPWGLRMMYGDAEDRFFHWLRHEVTKAVLHEIDESLHVDGVRRWDPHAGGR